MTHRFQVQVGDQYVYCEGGWDLDQLIHALTTGMDTDLQPTGKRVPIEEIKVSLEPSVRKRIPEAHWRWRRIGT